MPYLGGALREERQEVRGADERIRERGAAVERKRCHHRATEVGDDEAALWRRSPFESSEAVEGRIVRRAAETDEHRLGGRALGAAPRWAARAKQLYALLHEGLAEFGMYVHIGLLEDGSAGVFSFNC